MTLDLIWASSLLFHPVYCLQSSDNTSRSLMNERFKFPMESTKDTSLDSELSKIMIEKLIMQSEAEESEPKSTQRNESEAFNLHTRRQNSSRLTYSMSPTKNLKQSPIKRSLLDTQHREFDKVDDLMNKLSEKEAKGSRAKDAGFKKQYEKIIEDLKDILSQLRISQIECPSISLAPDISPSNYVQLIKYNQHLHRLIFQKNQDIEMVNFMLSVFLSNIETKQSPSEEWKSIVESNADMYYEDGSLVTMTHQIPTTSKIINTRDYKERKQYFTPQRDIHTEEFDRTSSFELDKENISTPMHNDESPVKLNLQKLFKSHEDAREDKLRKINENVFLD